MQGAPIFIIILGILSAKPCIIFEAFIQRHILLRSAVSLLGIETLEMIGFLTEE